MSGITTAYGHDSTAEEVARGIDLTGRRIIVTGGASGIGIETARALAGTGAEITLAVRDVAAGERAATEIAETNADAAVQVSHLDLAERASISAFVAGWSGPLHVLVNNAGVMACPEHHTPEGWELQFATNHLGHFALALGLREALATDGSARIVAVSSGAHRRSPVVFEDIHFERREYEPWLAYGQSKTANSLFAVEATRRFADDGITANALMPGVIMTNLQRHMDEETRTQMAKAGRFGSILFKTPAQGAATSVLLATAPELSGVGGRYFEDCNEAPVVPADFEESSGVREYAVDPEAAERLWDESLRMLAS